MKNHINQLIKSVQLHLVLDPELLSIAHNQLLTLCESEPTLIKEHLRYVTQSNLEHLRDFNPTNKQACQHALLVLLEVVYKDGVQSIIRELLIKKETK